MLNCFRYYITCFVFVNVVFILFNRLPTKEDATEGRPADGHPTYPGSLLPVPGIGATKLQAVIDMALGYGSGPEKPMKPLKPTLLTLTAKTDFLKLRYIMDFT